MDYVLEIEQALTIVSSNHVDTFDTIFKGASIFS